MVAVGRLTSKYFLIVKGGGTLMYRMYKPEQNRLRKYIFFLMRGKIFFSYHESDKTLTNSNRARLAGAALLRRVRLSG